MATANTTAIIIAVVHPSVRRPYACPLSVTRAPFVTHICLKQGSRISTARHLKTGKRQKGNRKGKRGREPTIVIVFFRITTIVGESSQKLNKIGKTFLSRCGVYLPILRKDKSIEQKTKAGESEEKDKTFSAMWKKTKAFNKSSPFSLHFSRC
jgi:hypothetical protein